MFSRYWGVIGMLSGRVLGGSKVLGRGMGNVGLGVMGTEEEGESLELIR